MFLQLPHQAAAKSARKEGWNAWTRDSSLNFRGLRVAVLVEMICEIVNGATSAPSIDTTNRQRRGGEREGGGEDRCWIVLEQRFLLQLIFVSSFCSFWIDCSFVMGWRKIRCRREVRLELAF